MDEKKKNAIKEGIIEAVKKGNEFFPDIEEFLESKGIDYTGGIAMCYTKNPHIIMWAGWNAEGNEALKEILKEENISIVYGGDYFCLVHFIIGKGLSLPIAKSMKYPYKRDHWIPCALRLTV